MPLADSAFENRPDCAFIKKIHTSTERSRHAIRLKNLDFNIDDTVNLNIDDNSSCFPFGKLPVPIT